MYYHKISHSFGTYKFPIALKFIRRLGSTTVEPPAKFQSDVTILETQSRGFETLWHMHIIMGPCEFQIKKARTKEAKEWCIKQSLDLLERYVYLILFNAYLHCEKWTKPFSTWMKEVSSLIIIIIIDIIISLSSSSPSSSSSSSSSSTSHFGVNLLNLCSAS